MSIIFEFDWKQFPEEQINVATKLPRSKFSDNHWKSSVEELDIDGFEKLSYNKLLELKLVPKLRTVLVLGIHPSPRKIFMKWRRILKSKCPIWFFRIIGKLQGIILGMMEFGRSEPNDFSFRDKIANYQIINVANFCW